MNLSEEEKKNAPNKTSHQKANDVSKNKKKIKNQMKRIIKMKLTED